jgi:DNA mismatch endonuclease (patch repair protein)
MASFGRYRKAIELRGCFWHGHTCGRCRIPVTRRAYWVSKIARNRRRDRRMRAALRRRGWRVLVVWECQTRDAARLRERLLRFLD